MGRVFKSYAFNIWNILLRVLFIKNPFTALHYQKHCSNIMNIQKRTAAKTKENNSANKAHLMNCHVCIINKKIPSVEKQICSGVRQYNIAICGNTEMSGNEVKIVHSEKAGGQGTVVVKKNRYHAFFSRGSIIAHYWRKHNKIKVMNVNVDMLVFRMFA